MDVRVVLERPLRAYTCNAISVILQRGQHRKYSFAVECLFIGQPCQHDLLAFPQLTHAILLSQIMTLRTSTAQPYCMVAASVGGYVTLGKRGDTRLISMAGVGEPGPVVTFR